MAKPTANFFLDISDTVQQRMREHAQALPAHLADLLNDPDADPQQGKLALATVLIPSLQQQAIAIYQADHRRAVLVCDQAGDIGIYYLAQDNFAQALDWLAPAMLNEIALMTQVYDPSSEAVVIMLGRNSAQALLVRKINDIRSAGAYPLVRQPKRPLAPRPAEMIDQIAELHADIHKNDPLPATDKERQAATVMAGLKQSIQEIILKGVPINTIELSLFYHWLRLVTLNREISESLFNTWTTQLIATMSRIIKMVESSVAVMKDDGPSLQMAVMGSKIEEIKTLYQSIATSNQQPSQREIERHTAVTNERLFEQISDWLNDEINPGIIENGLFYYWLRISTINANVPETFFQKIERNWEKVQDKVEELIQEMTQR
jgi:hypothetical protein